jgi:hypothetical protein
MPFFIVYMGCHRHPPGSSKNVEKRLKKLTVVQPRL